MTYLKTILAPSATRGLTIRAAFAAAKLRIFHEPEAGNDDIAAVAFDAECMGLHDYKAGIYDVPGMFLDEPDLKQSWESGQAFGVELEEMHHCSSCKSAQGDPCQIHD